ncbi:hypothetical protein D3C85_1210120 [compost metagenome]
MSVVSIESYKKDLFNKSLDYDVENYERVLTQSVNTFNSFSVLEKAELYSTLAEFNIGLVKYLHELNKKNDEKEASE